MKVVRRKIRYPFYALLLLVLLSCAPRIIHMSHLAKLRMDMNPNEPAKVMGVSPRRILQWSVMETGDSIIVQSYVLSSGEWGSIYFLAYRNGSLIFWGYPHEFARSSDPFIREIGKEALSRQVKPPYSLH